MNALAGINWSQIQYFKPAELACKHCGVVGVQPALVFKLDELREKFGKPLVVTSGYRCPVHNAAVSETGEDGPHTTGLAVDLAISGRDAYVVIRLALAANWTGIGVSQKGPSRFLHLDLIPDSFGHARPMVWSY